MALSSKEKKVVFVAKMERYGLKEMRGVYVPVKHEKKLKADLRAKVKNILEGN